MGVETVVDTNVDETPDVKVVLDVNAEGAAADDSKGAQTDAEIIEKSLLEEGLEDEDGSDDNADKDGKKPDDGGSEGVYEKPDISDVMGEGAEFDEDLFNKMTPVFSKLKASQEDVNEIAKVYAEHVKTAAVNHGKMLVENYNKIKDDWRKESMEEFSSDFKGTLKSSGTFVKQFGDEEAIQILTDTGVGNHKAIIRMLSKAGKYFVEDEFPDGDKSSSSDAKDVLYPTMEK